MYTRRNSIESSGQHWIVLLAAVLTTWMAWSTIDTDAHRLGAAVTVGLLLANALSVTGLAVRAVHQGQSLVDTMRWESVTTYVSILLVAVLVAVTGGLAAPTLFLAFLWAPYLGMSVELGYSLRGGLLLVGASVGIAGWYSDTWTDHWQTGLLVGATLTFLVGVVYFYASDLYAERFTAEQLEAAVSSRVEELSRVLVETAEGDLTVTVRRTPGRCATTWEHGPSSSTSLVTHSTEPWGRCGGWWLGCGRVGSGLGRRRLRCWWRLGSRRLLRRSSPRRWRRRARRLRSWRRRRRRSRRRLSRWRRSRRRRWGLLSRVRWRCRRRWSRWIRSRLGWM